MRQPMLLLRHAAGQQPDPQPQRLKQRLRALIVLTRQHLRRRHQRGLIAAHTRQIDRAEGHGGLAAAHVALHHARHRAERTHVRRRLLKHAPLRAGGRKRRFLPEFIEPRVRNVDLHAGFTGAARE